ncbi:MAG: hypothetical protein ACI910_001020, partial [Oleispira sp.]
FNAHIAFWSHEISLFASHHYGRYCIKERDFSD